MPSLPHLLHHFDLPQSPTTTRPPQFLLLLMLGTNASPPSSTIMKSILVVAWPLGHSPSRAKS